MTTSLNDIVKRQYERAVHYMAHKNAQDDLARGRTAKDTILDAECKFQPNWPKQAKPIQVEKFERWKRGHDEYRTQLVIQGLVRANTNSKSPTTKYQPVRAGSPPRVKGVSEHLLRQTKAITLKRGQSFYY